VVIDPGDAERGCDFCADNRNMYFGHVE